MQHDTIDLPIFQQVEFHLHRDILRVVKTQDQIIRAVRIRQQRQPQTGLLIDQILRTPEWQGVEAALTMHLHHPFKFVVAAHKNFIQCEKLLPAFLLPLIDFQDQATEPSIRTRNPHRVTPRIWIISLAPIRQHMTFPLRIHTDHPKALGEAIARHPRHPAIGRWHQIRFTKASPHIQLQLNHPARLLWHGLEQGQVTAVKSIAIQLQGVTNLW